MDAVYQFIVLPVEVAFKFDDEPPQIVAGVAVTELAVTAKAEIKIAPETFVVVAPPLELVTVQ